MNRTKMKIWKRITASTAALVLSISTLAAPVKGAAQTTGGNWPQGPETACGTAVIMEAADGVVLYDKSMDEVRYPASITKILTALLAIENLSLDAQLTFSETSVATELVEGSSTINMKLGETITVRDCLYGLMIQSANEAAVQLAEAVSGTEAAFAQKMTERAKSLGCKNTNFTNASGLPDVNHYTTAYDMALIFREAIKNDTFMEITGAQNYTIPATAVSQERPLNTHHPLMASGAPEYYEGCFGGKSGNTVESGMTLVSGAKRNDMTLITVVLQGTNMSSNCQDTIHMLDFGFQNFSRLSMPVGYAIVPKGVTAGMVQTTKEKQQDGRTLYKYNYKETLVGTAYEEAKEETAVPQEEEKTPLKVQPEQADKEQESSFSMVNILLIILGVVILAMLVFLIALKIRERKRRRRRRRRRNNSRKR